MDEPAFAPLLRFAALMRRGGHKLALAEGALEVARMAFPDLDPRPSLLQLDQLAALVREDLGLADPLRLDARLGAREQAERAIGALRRVLAEREGFCGDGTDHYDPRNSYLNLVILRRTGLPITLSVVYLEVAWRLGWPLCGVGLPGHFVTKWPLAEDDGGDLYLDAFGGGRTMTARECAALVNMPAAYERPFDLRWLEPVGTHAILTRMLTNLKIAYLQRGETGRALEAVERLLLLHPSSAEELRDRGLLRLAMGEPLLAAVDIATYAQRAPAAPDAQRLSRRLSHARQWRAFLN